MKRFLLPLVAVAAVQFASAADGVRVDFTREEGPVKPLDGLCNSPLPFVPWENETLRDLTEIEQLGTPFGKPTSVYWMFQKFAEMRRLGTSCVVRDDPSRAVYAIAAKGEKGKAFLIANDSFDEPRTVRLELVGADLGTFTESRLGDGRLKFEPTGKTPTAEFTLPPKTAAYFRAD